MYDLIWLIIDIFLIYVRFVFLCSSQKSYSVIDTKGKWTAISLDPKTHSELPRTCALQSKFFLHLRILHYMFRFSECLYMYVSSSIFRSDCVSPAYSTRTKKFPTAERDKFVSLLTEVEVNEFCDPDQVHRIPYTFNTDVVVPPHSTPDPKSQWYTKDCALCGPCNSADRVMWICCGVTACRRCACTYYDYFKALTCPWCNKVFSGNFNLEDIIPAAPKVTKRVDTETRTKMFRTLMSKKGMQ